MLCSDFSTRLMMSRSTDSGEAPGYGNCTTMTGISTSGIWLTRRCVSASRPRHMSTMMMATVVTGCLMLKLERNMLFLRDYSRFGISAGTDLLSIFQRAVRETQDLVAFGEARLQCIRAAARVALTEVQRHLLQLVTAELPRERAVTFAHHRGGRHGERRRAPRLDAAFGIEAGDVRLLLAIVEGHQHFDLARGGIGGRVHARDHAREFLFLVAVDVEPHVLAGLHFADAVGRDEAFETQARRIDDLQQFLAHLRGVASRNLAVADDAVEGRTHLGALEHLARGDHARARGLP